MYTKQNPGTRYANCILVLSAIKPKSRAHTAPPTIAIITNDEPSFVFLPKPRMLREKMVGNMIDIKKSTPSNAYTGKLPCSSTAKLIKNTFNKL